MLGFYYDGTRWLSDQLFYLPMSHVLNNITVPLSATAADAWGAPVPALGTDIYLVDCVSQFFVSGGTALGASHKWVGDIHKRIAAGTNTTIATVNINSGSSSVFRTDKQAINALLGNGTTYYMIQSTWTKTGTPGTLVVAGYFTYRIVQT